MKTNDDDIKKALQQNIQRIDDDSFTNSIVAKHLANKKIIKNRAFINFLPMIIGLSTVILSIGFVLLIQQNNDLIKEIGFTENHALITLATSIIFSFLKFLEEFTASTRSYTIRGNGVI